MCIFCEQPSRRSILTSAALLGAGAIAAPAVANAASAADQELSSLLRSHRVCFKGGIVISMDKQVGDFAQGDVLIENGKIIAIAPKIDVSPANTTIVDARGRIVMPGFVDTHHHFYQGLLRSVLPNGLLDPDYNVIIGDKLTTPYLPSDVYIGTLITALGMMDMGTTLAVDTSQVSHTPEHSDAGIKAHQDSGMRVVYAYWMGTGAAAQYPQDSVRLRKTYFQSEDQLLTLALGSILDPKIFAYARANDLRIVSHGAYGTRAPRVMSLDKAGLLRAGDEMIHCDDLPIEVWKMFHDRGIRVSLAPPIEMAMGHGMPGIQAALDSGVRPSLSSDVDATMAQDPFTIMRTTLTLQRALVLQRERAGEKNLPSLLTSRDVLEFATIEGARCAGLESKTGSLTPGKEADLILLRTDLLNIWPINNAVGAIVNIMNPTHVESVFVRGKVKKWRGSMVGVETARVLRDAAAARDALFQRAAFKLDLLG